MTASEAYAHLLTLPARSVERRQAIQLWQKLRREEREAREASEGKPTRIKITAKWGFGGQTV